MVNPGQLDSLRIDKWLWAARFYKTRQLAVKALKNGKITLAGNSPKPATTLKPGDQLTIKRGPYRMTVRVTALLDRRGSATIAQTMYEETSDSVAAREQLKQQLANQPRIDIDSRKPDKRGVRSNRLLKRGE
ncbi:MAG: RNA-binding S4 domain-containing protein [Pseudomonadota bacterium]